MQYLGLYKYGKIIYPQNISYPLRDHKSFINSAQNVVDGIELDILGSNPGLKPSSNGILGPVKLAEFVKLPVALPLETMHALDLGIFKNFNDLFFHNENRREDFYLGKLNYCVDLILCYLT